MKCNKSILIVDDNEEYAKGLAAYVESNGSFLNVSYAFNGEEGLSLFHMLKPDIVVLDLIMPRLDGIGFMRELDTNYAEKRPLVIMNSERSLAGMLKAAAGYGVDYFMLKPQSYESVLQTICDLGAAMGKSQIQNEPQPSIEEYITKFMRGLGMPAHLQGYKYMRSAIDMLLADNTLLSPITKKLYPMIAQRYGTSKHSVERALRHAISVSWERGNKKLLNDIFGYTVDNMNLNKPTNSEYIAMVVDDFKLRMKHHTF